MVEEIESHAMKTIIEGTTAEIWIYVIFEMILGSLLVG